MRIRILDTIWTIHFANPDNIVFIMPNGERTIGVTDTTTKEIFIANNLDRELEREVVIHELCHAQSYVTGLNLSEKDEECMCMWIGKNT